jgi:hypothetical protein
VWRGSARRARERQGIADRALLLVAADPCCYPLLLLAHRLRSKYQHEHQHASEFSHDAPKAHDWGTASGRPLGRGAATLTTGAGHALPAAAGRVLGTAPAPAAAGPSARGGGSSSSSSSSSSSNNVNAGASAELIRERALAAAAARARLEQRATGTAVKRAAPGAAQVVASPGGESGPDGRSPKRAKLRTKKADVVSPGGESGPDGRSPKRAKLRAKKADVVDLSSSSQ